MNDIDHTFTLKGNLCSGNTFLYSGGGKVINCSKHFEFSCSMLWRLISFTGLPLANNLLLKSMYLAIDVPMRFDGGNYRYSFLRYHFNRQISSHWHFDPDLRGSNPIAGVALPDFIYCEVHGESANFDVGWARYVPPEYFIYAYLTYETK